MKDKKEWQECVYAGCDLWNCWNLQPRFCVILKYIHFLSMHYGVGKGYEILR
jgi:hypothetical protein